MRSDAVGMGHENAGPNFRGRLCDFPSECLWSRSAAIPIERPVGLSLDMAEDPVAQQRWRAYVASLDLPDVTLGEVLDEL